MHGSGPRPPTSRRRNRSTRRRCADGEAGGPESPILPPVPEPRFLTLDQVAEELATSRAQIYALVRRGDLAAIKLGGREQWRVERTAREEYLDRTRAETAAWIAAHPSPGRGDEAEQACPPRSDRAAMCSR